VAVGVGRLTRQPDISQEKTKTGPAMRTEEVKESKSGGEEERTSKKWGTRKGQGEGDGKRLRGVRESQSVYVRYESGVGIVR
jgi:hypothetical protein